MQGLTSRAQPHPPPPTHALGKHTHTHTHTHRTRTIHSSVIMPSSCRRFNVSLPCVQTVQRKPTTTVRVQRSVESDISCAGLSCMHGLTAPTRHPHSCRVGVLIVICPGTIHGRPMAQWDHAPP